MIGYISMTSMERSTRIRVVITADHEGIRLALGELLTSIHDIEVVGCAATAQAVALATALEPDIVLLDSGMPVAGGRDLVRDLTRAVPALRIVTLSTFQERRQRTFGHRSPVCVLKDERPEDLISCIRATAARVAA